jgi:hypothetical protein
LRIAGDPQQHDFRTHHLDHAACFDGPPQETMNCMGFLSFTRRVNRFAPSSSPFRPQEQAPLATKRHNAVTDSGDVAIRPA